MNLSLPPQIDAYARQQANRRGESDPSQYICELIERDMHDDWRQRLLDRIGPIDWDEVNRLLEEGAIVHRERDLRIAEEWFPLEEEIYRDEDSAETR